EYEAISNSWVQLNDEGEPFSIITVQRIFRNLPFIRYIGKIHESIFIQNKAYNAENLHIMHTGYAQTEYERAGKRERNIRMLKTELKDDPYNPTAMIYLADSIKAASTEEAYKEAEDLYLKALTGKRQAESAIKRLAYDFLINRYLDNLSKINEAITLCDDAIKVLPNIIDYVYFRAVLQNKKGNFKDALIDLQQCEKAFTTGTNPPETRVLMPSQILLYHQLFISAIGLKDKQMEATTRAIIMALLTEAKNGSTTLGPYLVALVKENKNGAEIFESLSPVYNINNPQDLILITRAAKEYGIIGLAQLTLEMASRIINSKEC
ncbi:MAG: hypothetical protein LBC73_03030, partial [Oscillospiraceae bacterium]|nr:hypothetical protein [Oscillospiraceae bacterium]